MKKIIILMLAVLVFLSSAVVVQGSESTQTDNAATLEKVKDCFGEKVKDPADCLQKLGSLDKVDLTQLGDEDWKSLVKNLGKMSQGDVQKIISTYPDQFAKAICGGEPPIVPPFSITTGSSGLGYENGQIIFGSRRIDAKQLSGCMLDAKGDKLQISPTIGEKSCGKEGIKIGDQTIKLTGGADEGSITISGSEVTIEGPAVYNLDKKFCVNPGVQCSISVGQGKLTIGFSGDNIVSLQTTCNMKVDADIVNRCVLIRNGIKVHSGYAGGREYIITTTGAGGSVNIGADVCSEAGFKEFSACGTNMIITSFRSENDFVEYIFGEKQGFANLYLEDAIVNIRGATARRFQTIGGVSKIASFTAPPDITVSLFLNPLDRYNALRSGIPDPSFPTDSHSAYLVDGTCAAWNVPGGTCAVGLEDTQDYTTATMNYANYGVYVGPEHNVLPGTRPIIRTRISNVGGCPDSGCNENGGVLITQIDANKNKLKVKVGTYTDANNIQRPRATEGLYNLELTTASYSAYMGEEARLHVGSRAFFLDQEAVLITSTGKVSAYTLENWGELDEGASRKFIARIALIEAGHRYFELSPEERKNKKITDPEFLKLEDYTQGILGKKIFPDVKTLMESAGITEAQLVTEPGQAGAPAETPEVPEEPAAELECPPPYPSACNPMPAGPITQEKYSVLWDCMHNKKGFTTIERCSQEARDQLNAWLEANGYPHDEEGVRQFQANYRLYSGLPLCGKRKCKDGVDGIVGRRTGMAMMQELTPEGVQATEGVVRRLPQSAGWPLIILSGTRDEAQYYEKSTDKYYLVRKGDVYVWDEEDKKWWFVISMKDLKKKGKTLKQLGLTSVPPPGQPAVTPPPTPDSPTLRGGSGQTTLGSDLGTYSVSILPTTVDPTATPNIIIDLPVEGGLIDKKDEDRAKLAAYREYLLSRGCDISFVINQQLPSTAAFYGSGREGSQGKYNVRFNPARSDGIPSCAR